jgi:hypothetical protein
VDPNKQTDLFGPRIGLKAKPAHMKDLRRRLEKVRADAREFMLMSQQATDIEKRELFKRLADELAFEALELELIVKKNERANPCDQHEVVEFKPPSQRTRG